MFALLAMLTLFSPLPLTTRWTACGPDDRVIIGFALATFVGLAIPLAGLFAAIYVPVRWKYLMGLSRSRRTLALVGGFGLMGLTVLWGLIVAVLLILS